MCAQTLMHLLALDMTYIIVRYLSMDSEATVVYIPLSHSIEDNHNARLFFFFFCVQFLLISL